MAGHARLPGVGDSVKSVGGKKKKTKLDNNP